MYCARWDCVDGLDIKCARVANRSVRGGWVSRVSVGDLPPVSLVSWVSWVSISMAESAKEGDSRFATGCAGEVGDRDSDDDSIVTLILFLLSIVSIILWVPYSISYVLVPTQQAVTAKDIPLRLLFFFLVSCDGWMFS